MNTANEQRDYMAAGALAEELPYWGFLPDDRTCLTRAGELLTIGRLTPHVVDGRTPEQLDTVLDRWARMLSTVEAGSRIGLYLARSPLAPESDASERGDGVSAIARRRRQAFLSGRVQDMSAHIVWCHNPGLQQTRAGAGAGVWWLEYGKAWVAHRRAPHESVYLYSQLAQAGERFRQAVDASRAMVDDLTPVRILDGREGARFLNGLINRPGLGWDGATGSGMNWRLAVSELEAERRYLRLDGEPVILYSLLSPPGAGRANLLDELYRLDAHMSVALEWRPWSAASGRKKIRDAQRHYFSQRYSLAAHVQETEGTASAMEDSAAGAEADRLSRALVELETDGIGYGDVSLSVALHGDLAGSERLDGDIRRIFAQHDAKVIREGYGQLSAWWARMPGQPRGRQLRKVFMSAGAAACLSPLFGPPRGPARSPHLDRPCLTTLETRWRTPYHYDLFGGSDVGHTLVLGATGSGKSFLLNFLLVQALQYGPRVVILDLGGSYRWLTRFLGGGYMELSPDEAGAGAFRLRPFALPAGERTYAFLAGWVRRLMRIGGQELSGDDPSEIRARIEDLYAQPPERRTLSALVYSMPKRMWAPMSRWCGDGAWARYFDHAADGEDPEYGDWQVIDLAGATEHVDLCEAALFYLLERMRLSIEAPADLARLKLMVVDEAWRYLQDPAVLAYLAEAAKTWRKKNAALVMATQSAVDVTATPGASGLLESMPTKLFLANPNLPAAAGALFGLNPGEVDTIRGLVPKQELYLRRATGGAILHLAVDPASYWLYTSSPRDARKRAEAVEQHGLEHALEHLSRRSSC